MHELAAAPEFARWMGRQRWFSGETAHPSLLAHYSVLSTHDVDGVVLIVADDTTGGVFQVPLALRTADPADGAILRWNDRFVTDGTHDHDVAAALFGLAVSEGTAAGELITTTGVPFEPNQLTVRSTHVLKGEQSNTSIIVDTETPTGEPGTPAILKVFRMVHDGDNPDVTLQSAIAAAGSDRVPRSLGALVGEWGDSRGHLAFAQEFLPGTRDAWRVALDAATEGTDFRDRAFDLGAATAEVHAILAASLPTVPPSSERVQALRESFRNRALAAFVAVPELEALRDSIDAVYDRAATEPWPQLQRVHGDYHLGQVLDVPGRGWVLLDFEGEPLRPMSERNDPDLALRDVAGMLRSFDYVAGSVSLSDETASERARAWAESARAGFLEGYASHGGDNFEAHPTLLAALELDKALYETLYEARNRPTWLPIPQTAVERLVQAALGSLNG